jgi:hypothetical protein
MHEHPNTVKLENAVAWVAPQQMTYFVKNSTIMQHGVWKIQSRLWA